MIKDSHVYKQHMHIKYDEMMEILVNICKATNLYHAKIHIQNMTKHIVHHSSSKGPFSPAIRVNTVSYKNCKETSHVYVLLAPHHSHIIVSTNVLPIYNDSSKVGEYSMPDGQWSNTSWQNTHKVYHASTDAEW